MISETYHSVFLIVIFVEAFFQTFPLYKLIEFCVNTKKLWKKLVRLSLVTICDKNLGFGLRIQQNVYHVRCRFLNRLKHDCKIFIDVLFYDLSMVIMSADTI